MVNDEPEFEILEILDTKIDNCCRACKLLYLVHWTGYEGTKEETSWILASKLGHTSELIADFHAACQDFHTACQDFPDLICLIDHAFFLI